MKNKIYKLAIFSGLALLFLAVLSCEDLLNPIPQTSISPEAAFSTPNGVRSALVSVYSNETMWAAYWATMLPDTYGNPDVSEGGDNAGTIAASHGILTPTTEIVNSGWESIWDGFYRSVSNANFLIENESKISNMDEVEKKTILAEARFLRAKAYYLLVNFFGDVPLLLNTFKSLETDRFPVRTPIADVYAQMIVDLEYGVTNLPEGNFNGHVKKGAAQALLAKVYMAAPDPVKNYTRAEELTSDIVSSQVYELEPNYDDLWWHSGKNKANSSKECIYGCVLTSLGDYKGGAVQFLSSPRSPSPWFLPKKSLVGDFIKLNDTIRLKSSFMFLNEPAYTTGYYLYKFTNVDWRVNLVAQMKGENNEYFLRYADILLLRAEILNEINTGPNQEAIDMVNLVRRRAKVADLKPAEYTNKETFLLTLIRERKHELIFEGHLFFDLKRMGKATQLLWNMDDNGTKTTNFAEYQLLFPLPEKELSINPSLVQNEGYF